MNSYFFLKSLTNETTQLLFLFSRLSKTKACFLETDRRGFRRILSLVGFETSGKPFDRREERWRTGRRRGGSVGKGRGRGSPCRAKERGCGTSPCTDERLHPSLWSQVHDASSCVARCFDDASSWVFRAACASYARHEIRSVSETFWTEFDRNGAGRRNSSAKSLWVNDSYVNYGSR